MIGIQTMNNLLQFFAAMRRTCTRVFVSQDKNHIKEQWEKDNELFDFKSNILIDEYLDLGKIIYEYEIEVDCVFI